MIGRCSETLTDLQDRSRGPIWTHFCYRWTHSLMHSRWKISHKIPVKKDVARTVWGPRDQLTLSDRSEILSDRPKGIK
jgi:hypothetical protein